VQRKVIIHLSFVCDLLVTAQKPKPPVGGLPASETQGSLDSCEGSPALGQKMCGDARLSFFKAMLENLKQPRVHSLQITIQSWIARITF
jgi:hypothetical protein